MRPVEAFLARLDRVRQTGARRWIACCPAHEDKSPSLSLRELEDSRLLLHCFGGCTALEVLDSVALQMRDLYPDGARCDYPRQRRAWSAFEVLAAIAQEALVVMVAASALARGEVLSSERRERLLLAAERMQRAMELVRA